MKIHDIENPTFLKTYDHKELEQLAHDIREFLIASVATTGGHLSSNLGVVELTIALHYVFNSPVDKLIFDVGHQSYVHKILTGRAKDFGSLRRWQGISGFQKRSESIHDVWEAGHSSTALSAAVGYSIARDLDKDNYFVVPIVGDGSLTNGMTFEALNQIGALKKNMIIIFNDNNMSVSQNVGAINQAFDRLRSSKQYTEMKKEIKGALSKNTVGETVLHGLQSVKDLVKRNVVDGSIFTELGIEYYGPVNGHSIRDLVRVIEVAKKHEGPILIHVVTKKGKGYSFSEVDEAGKWHGVGSFNPKTGASLDEPLSDHLSWSEAISRTLIRLAKNDKDIIALTPAMMGGSKLEEFAKQYPERFFDCGIAEEHATTLAAGLAIAGKKPFLSIYSSFLQRSYDQVNHDITRMDLPVVIGVDRSGLVGEDGDTHHGVFDISILNPLPNLIIAQGKDATEAQHLLYTAFNQPHPFALRYPRGSIYFQDVTEFKQMEIGKWDLLPSLIESQAYLITYGPDVERFSDKIKVNNLPITVVNARFIKPLDQDVLNDLAKSKLPIFSYEGEQLLGGLSSSIIAYYNDNNLEKELKRFGIGDHYVEHGSINELKKHYNLDITSVLKAIMEEISGSNDNI